MFKLENSSETCLLNVSKLSQSKIYEIDFNKGEDRSKNVYFLSMLIKTFSPSLATHQSFSL